MTDTNSRPTENHDVVIVGSGVAGALLADRLAIAGYKVLILEAGQTGSRSDSVKLYQNGWLRSPQSAYERLPHALFPDENASDRYVTTQGNCNYRLGYLRQVGGTTWHWTGITPRFLPADFALKSTYGVGKDWPINYGEIEPYYLQAEIELGIAGDSEDHHGSPRSGPYPMPALAMPYSDQVIARILKPHNIPVQVLPAARNSVPYRNRPACCGNNSCTPICPIGAQYSADTHIRSAIQHGARLIENAVVYKITSGRKGEITSLDYKSPNGQITSITAKYYVLACNGIETPKLLLISRSMEMPAGIANSSGLVGRGLMDHPSIAVDFLMPEPIYLGRGPQVVSALGFGRDGEFRSRHAAGKCYILNTLDIQDMVTRLIEVEQDWDNIDMKLDYYAKHYCFIGVEMEQLPNVANLVRPSDTDFDAIGIPKPEISMNADEYTYKAGDHFTEYLNMIVDYLGAKIISSYGVGQIWPNHPMGTARMGNDPAHSVVDRNCRSHDHYNLFITGSSVFTTGGTANPTLTIAALSLRLADYIKSNYLAEQS